MLCKQMDEERWIRSSRLVKEPNTRGRRAGGEGRLGRECQPFSTRRPDKEAECPQKERVEAWDLL